MSVRQAQPRAVRPSTAAGEGREIKRGDATPSAQTRHRSGSARPPRPGNQAHVRVLDWALMEDHKNSKNELCPKPEGETGCTRVAGLSISAPCQDPRKPFPGRRSTPGPEVAGTAGTAGCWTESSEPPRPVGAGPPASRHAAQAGPPRRVLGGEDLSPRAPAEQSRAGWPQAQAHLKVCGLLFWARGYSQGGWGQPGATGGARI